MMISLFLLALAQEPLLLRLDPALGTTVRYRSSVQGRTLTAVIVATQKVIARTESTTVWEVHFDSTSMTMMDQSSHPGRSVDTVVTDRRGATLLSTLIAAPPAGVTQLAPLLPSAPLFPAEAVSVGATWRRDESIDSLVSRDADSAGRVIVTIHSRVAGRATEPLFGTDVAARGTAVARYDLTRGILLSHRSLTTSFGHFEGERQSGTVEMITEIVP